MELTRMTAALTKQVCPKSTAVVNIVAPWGEYYARNQRSIPPLLYADMTVQSGVNFDAFGLEFRFGAPRDGLYLRDIFQISSLLDVFVKLGKPVHITAVQVPSGTKASVVKGKPVDPEGGSRYEPWSEQIQAQWVRDFLDVALSKPVVESVSWHGLCDHKDSLIPTGGLLTSQLKPKAAYQEWTKTCTEIQAAGKKSSRGSAA